MTRSAFFGAALLALVLTQPARAEETTADTVVATVNGTAITIGHMIAARSGLPQQYQELPDDVLFKGLLEQLIQQTALAQAAGKSKADDLALENQSRAYLSSTVLEAAAKAAVTDDALKQLYDEKYVKAAPSKEYHAAHILVATEDEAKALKTEIDGGGDFAKLAKEKSTDQGSAANGGDLGWFGAGMMVKPFEDAVVVMKPGTVAGPIKTDFGWHLIKLAEVRDAKAPSFDEVKGELEGDLRQKAVETAVKEATDAAKVEKKDEGIDPAVLKNAALLGE